MSNVVECLKERGLVDALTSETLLQQAERPLKVYLGFDPTADSLHAGNLVGMVVLRWFQKFGHTPVVILGGATGRIGDPSGKSLERPLLDLATIASNVARIRRQFESVLDFFHLKARPLVLDNDLWLSQMPLIDFLRDVGKHFRIGTMLAKEMVRERLHSEEGISFTEFSYQLLQAYDFYYLFENYGVTVQLGGSDQWGNITAGTDFVRRMTSQHVYGLTFPLLTRSDGKKFGKTEEGAVWLAPDRFSPYQFYQYFIRTADADVIKLMRFLTFLPMEEILEYQETMGQPGYVPNTVQKRLAEEVTRLVHGEEGLLKAQKVTQNAAPGSQAVLEIGTLRDIAQDMPSTTLPFQEVIGKKYVEVMVKIGLLPSKAEVVRLIHNGGAYLNDVKVEDPSYCLSEQSLIGGEFLLLGAGKRKKFLLRVCK